MEARAEEEARAEKMRIGRCGGGERRRMGGAREVGGHANEANRAPRKCLQSKEGQYPPIVGAFEERERTTEEGRRPEEEREREPAPDGAEPRAGVHETRAADATTGLSPPAEAPVVPQAQPAGTGQPWRGVPGERGSPVTAEKAGEPVSAGRTASR